jgi:NDP-sugar pyrophosphorylase family protein
VLSAIVIVGPENRSDERCADTAGKLLPTVNPGQRGTPLVYVEVLGCSVIERLIDELQRGGVEKISVYQGIVESSSFPDIHSASPIEFCSAETAWSGAAQRLAACKDSGAEALVVARVAAYVDFDLKDALQFHREQGQAVTRAFNEEGPLDMWFIDPSQISDGIDILSAESGVQPARYFMRGYVNRLKHPEDLRRLAVDGLTARCGLRPKGTESRPGVWIDEGAQVHRDARIVAPAFIGRGTRIAEQNLITRCSNVESNCVIDYGTVVENSSILSNTYVGIGLDVAHSIVDGNNLLNLERGVSLGIADPCVFRQNRVPRPGENLRSPVSFGVESVPLVQAE